MVFAAVEDEDAHEDEDDEDDTKIMKTMKKITMNMRG